ncbi:peptidoglycan editing factor PgeF [Bacillus sp. T33-2]|uniref:peptidoglycan editing factor PgeF n=1 Tax=Bacillus sp. T33-2 TaxID=2054168 RepID=UPI000C791314|nr:peptidoglycan editing factor PgeF [Bacillus sp. T33-2]PLR97363.1 peptidoglycan editing factor PgeF [Bacillus sp. T33-2]
MEPFILGPEEAFFIQEWMENNPGLVAGFSTKNGGVSGEEFSTLNLGFHVGDSREAVCQNRMILSEKIAFPLKSWVGAEQTHEVNIKKATKSDRGKGAADYGTSYTATDGFFADEKGILLTLCFADCVPLFFLSPETGHVGLAHAGWKGTVHGIGKRMAAKFAANGVSPGRILAVIGPSICEKCYIVDNKVISLVQNILEGVEKKPYNQIKENQYHLDLRELNKQLLLNAGVREENIKVTGLCTSCHNEHFYSHRRDRGAAGRMIAFIGWKEDYLP